MSKLSFSLELLQQLDDAALSRLVSTADRGALIQFWVPSLPDLSYAGIHFVRAFSLRTDQLSAGEDVQAGGWLLKESSWTISHCGRWLRAQWLYKMGDAEAALAAYLQALRQHSDTDEMAYEAAQLACELQQPTILCELLHSLTPELDGLQFIEPLGDFICALF